MFSETELAYYDTDAIYYKMTKNKLKNLVLDCFIILISMLFILVGGQDAISTGKILLVIGIFSIVNLMFRFKEVDFIMIFLLFGFTYLIYMIPYYFYGIPYHYLTDYQKIDYTNNVLIIKIIFTRFVFFGISGKELGLSRLAIEKKNAPSIFNLLIFILIIMIPISLLMYPPQLGVAYTGEVHSSIWLEYCIIFIIICGLHCDTIKRKKILLIVSSIYVILPFLYSRRLQSIMIVLTLFMLFYRDRFKVKHIILLTIFAFVGFRLYASIRMEMSMTLFESIMSIDDEGVMGNNQGGVLVCSSTYWGLIQEGVFDWGFRLKSLVGVFFSIFLPASFNLEETYINFEALKYAPIPGNGGFTSIYLFIWGGYFGVLVGGIIFNSILRNRKNSSNIFVYTIFMFSTFPRWHSYNMFILVKMGFWLLFFLIVTDFMSKKKHLIFKK